MIDKLKKNPWFWVIVGTVIIFIILVIPVELPYNIAVQGKIIAGEEWLLHKQTGGSIIVSQRNHYLSTVLDDYSRYIIAWKLFSTMSSTDVKELLDLAITKTVVDRIKVRTRPRLLSDNGSC